MILRPGFSRNVNNYLAIKNHIFGWRSLGSRIPRSIRLCAPDFPDKCFLVTDAALDKLKELRASFHSGLRVKVDVGGCHGFQYIFALEDATIMESGHVDGDYRFGVPTNGDQGVEDALIMIDRASLDLIRDSTLDYSRELIGSKFVITGNSQIDDPCGCGVSFGLRK